MLRSHQQADRAAGGGRHGVQARDRGRLLDGRRGGALEDRAAIAREQLGQDRAQPAGEDAGPVQEVLLPHAQEVAAR